MGCEFEYQGGSWSVELIIWYIWRWSSAGIAQCGD